MNLGGLGLYRKTTNLFKPKYNQNEYWSGKGGKTHYDESIKQADDTTIMVEEFLINFLKKIEFKTVLDVACGYGRYIKIVNENFNVIDYHGIDISKDQIKKAKEYCSNNIRLKITSLESFNPGRHFDLVFAANILLHVKPIDIEYFVNRIIALSNKNVIVMDMGDSYQYEVRKQNYSNYTRCFAHDLFNLFEDNPSVDYVRRFTPSPKTSFYYLKLRDKK